MNMKVLFSQVQDFQLGVESYQSRLNLIAPRLEFKGIDKIMAYTVVRQPKFGVLQDRHRSE